MLVGQLFSNGQGICMMVGAALTFLGIVTPLTSGTFSVPLGVALISCRTEDTEGCRRWKKIEEEAECR